MAGQLRMTEEEKKAKLQVQYNAELDDILNKADNKGINLIELAKQYGSEIQLGQ